MEADAATIAPQVPAEQLLQAARGFTSLFWGIGVSLLLLTDIVRVGPASLAGFPWYVAGLFLVVSGAARLRRARLAAADWRRHAGLLLAAALMELYFVPFTTWWRQAPEVKWYALNMFFLILVTLWLLSLANRLVAHTAVLLRDRLLYMEARLCEISAALFILGPAFALLFYTLLVSLHAPNETVVIRIPPRYAWPVWMYVFFAVPFLLTMATAWDCKEQCLARLEEKPEA